MSSIQEKLENIQFDHTLWLNELIAAFNEISIYEDRLMKLIENNKDEIKEEELEKLLVEFIEQEQAAEKARDQIKKHMIHMNKNARLNGNLRSIANSEHGESRAMMEVFRGSYASLKEKFHRFAAYQD